MPNNTTVQTTFNSGVLGIPSTNWDYNFRLTSSGTNGQLEVASSRLAFTKSAGLGSQFIGWNNDGNPAAGSIVSASYTDSWVMNMIVTNTLTPNTAEFMNVGFQVTDNSGNYYAIMLLSDDTGSNQFQNEWKDGLGVTQTLFNSASSNTDVYLRIGWDAGTQTLSSSYSIDGSTYSLAGTFSPGGVWATTVSDGFWFEVFGNSNTAAAITGGVYADNFSLTAVPEPSTYAAIFGGLALGLAIWRRRKAA